MTVTYDLANLDSTIADISRIRFEIGDTVIGAGVLPNGANFSDVEIIAVFAGEGNSVMRAAAALCEVLSRRWTNEADVQAGDVSKKASQIADGWSNRAKTLREAWGTTTNTGGGTAYAFQAARNDGYST